MNVYTPYIDRLKDTVETLRYTIPQRAYNEQEILIDIQMLIARLSAEIELSIIKE